MLGLPARIDMVSHGIKLGGEARCFTGLEGAQRPDSDVVGTGGKARRCLADTGEWGGYRMRHECGESGGAQQRKANDEPHGPFHPTHMHL